MLTIYALFGEDIRIYSFSKSADDTFYGLSTLGLVLFTYEFLVSIYVHDKYFNGFYFWLDLLACVSVIPDIGWIWQYVSPSLDPLELIALGGDAQNASGSSSSINSVGKAGRASRAAARATKVIRIIRMIRLLRFVKLYKQADTAQLKFDKNKRNKEKKVDNDLEIPEESNISRRLSDSSNKRVISLVLLMILVLPLLDNGFWTTSYLSIYYEVEMLINNFIRHKDSLDSSKLEPLMFQSFVSMMVNHGYERAKPTASIDILNNPMIYFIADSEVMNLIFYDDPHKDYYIANGWTNKYIGFNYKDLRGSEISYYTYDYNTLAIFSNQPQGQAEAISSIYRTLFICVVLSMACFQFSNDAQTLVLNPIERMINYVRKVIKDPLNINEIKEEIDNMNEDNAALIQANMTWTEYFFGKNKNKGEVHDHKDQDTETINQLNLPEGGGGISNNPVNINENGELVEESSHNSNNLGQVNSLTPTKNGSTLNSNNLKNAINTNITQTISNTNTINSNQLKKDDKSDELNVKDQFETKILENAIQKLCNLLVLGVGFGGKDIIVENIGKNDDIDTLIPGRKINAIFAYVTIRDFYKALYIFEEEIMTVVNSIIAIVHEDTNIFQGYGNKIYNNEFLMIWKTEEQDQLINTVTAELVLMCFIKLQYDIKNNPAILDISDNYTRLFKEKYPKQPLSAEHMFKVNLSIAIHKGAAIEGSIGSEYKVDPSYISDDVYLTSALEKLTADYKVNMLMTDGFVNLMRESSLKYVRLIDKFLFNESQDEPVSIYTYDGLFRSKQGLKVDDELLTISMAGDVVYLADSLDNAIKLLNIDIFNNTESLSEPSPLNSHQIMNKIIVKSYEYLSQKDWYNFGALYVEALQYFKEGIWKESKKKFEECLKIKKQDGPCQFLIDYMSDVSQGLFMRPDKWMGYRTYADKKY